MSIRILWQSSTALDTLPPYREALERHARRILNNETVCTFRGVSAGVPDLHFRAIDFLNNVGVLQSCVAAVNEGCDVVALGCFVDPLLDELREVLPVPVLGMAQTSMQLACLVSRRFAVLGRNTAFVPKFHRELVERYGLAARCAGVFAEDVPFAQVLDGLDGAPEVIVATLEPAARRAREAGAEVLLLGCGVLNLIAVEQSIETLAGLPLLDTTGALMKIAETMVELQRRAGVTTSRAGSYSSPSAAQWDRALSVYGVHVPPPAGDEPPKR